MKNDGLFVLAKLRAKFEVNPKEDMKYDRMSALLATKDVFRLFWRPTSNAKESIKNMLWQREEYRIAVYQNRPLAGSIRKK